MAQRGRPTTEKEGFTQQVYARITSRQLSGLERRFPGKQIPEIMRLLVDQALLGDEGYDRILIHMKRELEDLEEEKSGFLRDIDRRIEDIKGEIEKVNSMPPPSIPQKDRNEMIRSLWPMFRATKKQMIRPPETWKGDMDVHRWWGEQGVDMTYDTVYRVWDEMEGITTR